MLRPQVADDLADRMHLKLEATGPRRPFRLDVVAESGEHHVFQVLEIVAVTAPRVARATSCPPLTDSTPWRTAQ
jgi:hypothetical protein